ncbi:MAG: VWA domain-containing protein [Phycisphaerales bacterium]
MQFLTPIAALIGAAIVVPALLLLYFLKLRRRTAIVSTTLLWRQAVRDLKANAPFQRLRWSWLLLIQLLLLAALFLAAARPIFSAADPVASRVILIVDVSASMQARLRPGAESTRFDRAKQIAREFIRDLERSGGAREVMLIAASADARIVAPFSGNMDAAIAAIASLDPTDEPGRLAPAIRLADAYLLTAGDASVEVVLISDGRFPDERAPELSSGAFRFLPVAEPPTDEEVDDAATRNFGIVTLAARRERDDRSSVIVFGVAQSNATESIATPVTLEVNGEIVETIVLEFDPAARDEDFIIPAERSFRFRVRDPGAGALLRARLMVDDILPVDDSAGLIMEPIDRSIALAVALDGSVDAFIADALEVLDLEQVETMSGAAYESMLALPAAEQATRFARYDLIVFDRYAPPVAPPIPSLSFGAAPPFEGIERVVLDAPASRRVLSWTRRHPVLRDVNLDPIAVASPARLAFDEDAGVLLALGDGGALIAAIERRGVRHLLVSFEILESNWPLHVAFAIFMQNAVEWLPADRRTEAGRTIQAGERATVRAVSDTVRMTGPVAAEWSVMPGESVTLPVFRRVGLYELEGVAEEDARLAVNLLSATESETRPAPSTPVTVAGATAVAEGQRAPRELWPWFVLAALAALALEWIVYTGRTRV